MKEKLFNYSMEEYKGNYKEHLLEQYKLYVEMADRISSRRQTANSFFLTINTALVALVGYTQATFVVGLSGMILCCLWNRIIKSYKGLNTGKFRVIHELERKLPSSPYDAEWVALGEGKNSKLYLPFTHIEIAVPWIFFGIHTLCVGKVFIQWILSLMKAFSATS